MASVATSSKALRAAAQTKTCTGLRPLPAAYSKPIFGGNATPVHKVGKMEARDMTVQAIGPMEVAQIAGEAGFIGGVAGVMVGITLVGLAFGFILLRVESLTEEGKI